MTPDLPELPFIPESNELRIRLLAWGRQCVMQERERAAKVCEELATTHHEIDDLLEELIHSDCAAEIRKEPK
jgi:hypothetical protein